MLTDETRYHILKRKLEEYDQLQQEIEDLRRELATPENQ